MSITLWHFNLQVNRPMSMRKDGIQTRKRKPKNPPKATAVPPHKGGTPTGKSEVIVLYLCLYLFIFILQI